jgi:hypothetical protein
MRTQTFFGIGAAFAALIVAMPAAASITQINSPITVKARIGWTITVNYGGFVDEQLIPGLKAQTIYTLQSVSHDKKTWTFDMTSIKNLSVAPVTSRVSVFGFDIDDDTNPNNVSGITLLNTSSTTSSIFSSVSLNSNVPQVGLIDICFTANNNCAGGGGNGVRVGDAAPVITPTFTLKLQNAANSLTFNNFFVRYQSITNVNQGDSGVGLVEMVSFVDPLPEPGTWLQMIAGFGLIGVLLRRQRRPHAA